MATIPIWPSDLSFSPWIARFMCVLIMATNRPVTLVSGIHSVVLLRWMRQFPLEACFKSSFETSITATGTFIPYCCNSMLASFMSTCGTITSIFTKIEELELDNEPGKRTWPKDFFLQCICLSWQSCLRNRLLARNIGIWNVEMTGTFIETLE